jgi:Flp pilus assembly protein TadG
MMKLVNRIARSRDGLGAAEFALVCPVLFMAIIGVAQLGILAFANAGLSNAVAEGARSLTVFPRPTDDQVKARIADKKFGLEAAYLSAPVITTGKSDNADFVEIKMDYTVPLNFVFFTGPTVKLTQTRRAFVYKTE